MVLYQLLKLSKLHVYRILGCSKRGFQAYHWWRWQPLPPWVSKKMLCGLLSWQIALYSDRHSIDPIWGILWDWKTLKHFSCDLLLVYLHLSFVMQSKEATNYHQSLDIMNVAGWKVSRDTMESSAYWKMQQTVIEIRVWFGPFNGLQVWGSSKIKEMPGRHWQVYQGEAP